MKITLMRDNDGATTMRTLDINLQNCGLDTV